MLCGWGLAGQDLLGGLLLLFVVVGVADQSVTHTVQHVDDVAEGLVHLAHGVVRRHLRRTTPAGTGDVLTRRPHLAGLVLHRLSVHIETARHRPHLVRVSHKARRHISISLSLRSFGHRLVFVYPPAGERGITLAATREPMLLIPRPASAPINPCENGLLGRPWVIVGAATLVSGRIGAARDISGAMPCQALGTDSPPTCWAWASDAAMFDPHDRSWPPTPPTTLASLPSTNLPTLAINVSLVLASVEPAAPLLAELPELMNIRAGVLANMPM